MMTVDGGAREPAIDRGEAADRKPDELVATRPASKMRIVFGCSAALFLVAAAVYYFADRRAGTDVAMRPAPESSPAITSTRPPESAESPAQSTATMPPSQPASPQQSATPAPSQDATPAPEPRVVAPAPEPQAPPPAAAAQDQTTVPTSEERKRSTESAAAAPRNEPAAGTAGSAPQPPSMRDQAAALPDQAAAAPKNETILVVMRGPANIRSTPGKGGRVIGTAAKNTAVKEVNRSGKWVEVETESGTGWIAAALLSPQPSTSP